VPRALRVVLLQDLEDLALELVDLALGAALPLYGLEHIPIAWNRNL
jgi:hypothetical protein